MLGCVTVGLFEGTGVLDAVVKRWLPLESQKMMPMTANTAMIPSIHEPALLGARYGVPRGRGVSIIGSGSTTGRSVKGRLLSKAMNYLHRGPWK